MHDTPREHKVWSSAARRYAEDGIVLALGAGVSIGSSLPSWSELICRLADRAAGNDGRVLLDQMASLGYSSAAIAGVVKTLIGGSYKKFLETVRGESYRDFQYFRQARYLPRALVDSVITSNSTLRAIGAFCTLRHADGSFKANRKVHAIVNFNLDAVLRAYTYSRYGTRILRTVERASAKASSSKINVFHVHGFLHFSAPKIGDPESETDSIVLAEDEYYDFFNKPLGMFSYTMLHLLREHAWLFVGLSMTDENLRRLLHYSYIERVQSYVAEGKRLSYAERKCRRHFAVLRHSTNARLDAAIDQALAKLGVNVAWLHDFAELPDRLAGIYATSDNAWQEVY